MMLRGELGHEQRLVTIAKLSRLPHGLLVPPRTPASRLRVPVIGPHQMFEKLGTSFELYRVLQRRTHEPPCQLFE